MTITPDLRAMLKGTVAAALDHVRAAYAGIETRAVPDAQGGAWVEMLNVPLGPPYLQDASFFVFLLPFNLPGSDIYPFFVRPDLARLDGTPLGPTFQITQLSWPGESQPRAVVQISRRTRGSFALQTAPQKVAKVLDWLASQ